MSAADTLPLEADAGMLLTADLAQLWEHGPVPCGNGERVSGWAFVRPLTDSERAAWGDASARADQFDTVVLVVALAQPDKCVTERHLLFYPKGETLPEAPAELLTFADERCEIALISTGGTA